MAKTGLELLEELTNKISTLDKRLIIIEHLMKELLNNKNSNIINELPKEEIKLTKGSVKIELNEKLSENELNEKPIELKNVSEIKQEPEEIKQEPEEIKQSNPSKCEIKTEVKAIDNSSKVRVIGRIRNANNKSVQGVNLKIYNSASELVKETRTSGSGEWICSLSVGKYKATAYLENIINKTIEFTLNPGDTIFRPATIQAD